MPFADEMIHRGTAVDLADALETAAPGVPAARLREAAETLAPLSLRERVDVLREAMLLDLGGSFTELAAVVRTAIRVAPGFTGWMIWPVSTAVSDSAAADGSPSATDDALDLLAELTGLLTSEFALRTLLRHDLDRTLAKALEWTTADDEHVRRLASEGTRPYLPWAVRVPGLTAEPGRTLPILDRLHGDPSDYVRRSVANHLNDLSRDHPELVVSTAAGWLGASGGGSGTTTGTTDRLVRHALRTLLKRGDPAALALLGYPDPGDALKVDGPHLDRDRVERGGSIELRATVRKTGGARHRAELRDEALEGLRTPRARDHHVVPRRDRGPGDLAADVACWYYERSNPTMAALGPRVHHALSRTETWVTMLPTCRRTSPPLH